MFQAIRKRDNWEDSLFGQENRIKSAEQNKILFSDHFQKDLERYRKWLAEKGLEGIRYK